MKKGVVRETYAPFWSARSTTEKRSRDLSLRRR